MDLLNPPKVSIICLNLYFLWAFYTQLFGEVNNHKP